jgi:hypothetical protein
MQMILDYICLSQQLIPVKMLSVFYYTIALACELHYKLVKINLEQY